MKLPDAETLKNLCALLRNAFEARRNEALRKSAELHNDFSSESLDMVAGYAAEIYTWQQAVEIIDRAESAWKPCSRCKQLAALTTESGVCLSCAKPHGDGCDCWYCVSLR